ncbi:hypothetical protein V6N13_038721 [Hibiscus sabdariffa]
MREVIKIIEDRVVELNPGNWGTQGFGPVEDIDMLKIAHFPCSITGASPIINKIEFKTRGRSFSSRRISLIKKNCSPQASYGDFKSAIVSASTGTVVLEEGRNGDIQG